MSRIVKLYQLHLKIKCATQQIPNMLNHLLLACVLLFATFKAHAQSFILPSITNICYGNAGKDSLGLHNNLKPVRRWEMSTTGDDPWISIANQTETMYYTNLTSTTWFRAIVQKDGEVEQYSSVAKVNVLPEAIPGIISGAHNICNADNSGNLILSGNTGTVTKWQYTTDHLWHDIPGSAGQIYQSYLNNNLDTWYRVLVQNGNGCIATKCDSFKLSVDNPTNAGSLAGTIAVCKGVNTGVVTLNGSVGNVLRWESSATGSAPWSAVTDTNKYINYTNLLNTTFYRAIVKNGSCTEIFSPIATITVNDASQGGLANGATAVCSKINSGEISLSGSLGNILKWQYSVNNGAVWNDTSILTTKIQYSNLTQTTIYQAQVKNGVCSTQLSSQAKITVYPLPTVAFNAPALPQGSTVAFANNSSIASGANKQFSWDFGDGAGSVAKNPTHVFDNAGTYKIMLQTTSDKGCVDSLVHNLDVYEVPKVDFAFHNICSKNKITFLNTSIISYQTPTYSWNFGDGSPLITLPGPEHKYSSPGSYQVTLTVSTPFSTASKTSTIQVYDQATPAFEVSNVCLGTNMQFLNKSMVKNGYLTYNWDFGDTKTSNDLNPVYNYNAPGKYTVRLITNSNYGCGDTIYKTVSVYPVATLNFTFKNAPFGNPVHFTDSTILSSGTFKDTWDFGDGNTSTTNNPEHTYSTAGNYITTLTVQSDSGCIATLSKTVWVYPKPHAAFGIQPVCVYDSTTLENQSTISSGSLTYLWNFGDDNISTDKNPKWKFNIAGTYLITLIATSDKNGVDTITKTLVIYPQPICEFSTINVCDGYPVIFNNNSSVISGNLVSYLWDFGDGSNAVRQSPVKQYLNPSTYHVSLTVLSDKNCKAAISHDVTVFDNPVANFNVAGVCVNQQVLPVNLSQNNNSSNYNWSMGDGTSYSTFAPTHVYTHAGIFTIRLVISDTNNCVDSLSRNVNIYALPPVNAGADTSIVLGFPIQLNGKGGAAYEWFPDEGLSSALIQSPIASPKITTTYYLTGTDQYGCVNRDSMTVTVKDNHILIANNIFTPDGNGKNDTWYVQNIENYPQAEVVVFNRWGTIVLHTKNYKNDWNGTNSNNDILPDGAYFYVITIPGTDIIYKGTVTILRNK